MNVETFTLITDEPRKRVIRVLTNAGASEGEVKTWAGGKTGKFEGKTTIAVKYLGKSSWEVTITPAS